MDKVQSNSKPISHKTWDGLLKRHAKPDGKVDYKGFAKDEPLLNQYLTLISQNHPNDANWSEAQQLAYWINAYNAFTVKLILDNYPIKSIKDITKGPSIPFINSPWDIKFIEIENQTYDLNNIEHGILRQHFNEPRIHFAINCASVGCPRLLNEAYKAETLESQLQKMTIEFINGKGITEIRDDYIQISLIFSWFGSDFKKETTLIEFLNKYSHTKINENVNVDFFSYDWHLNE